MNEETLPGKDRVAVVMGLRTPFARQCGYFTDQTAIELGVMVVAELLERSLLPRSALERIVFGQVMVLPEAPNVGREIVLGAGLPVSVDAYSVSRACTTSFQAAADIAQAIAAGEIEVGLAGGTDSTSVLPIQVSRPLAKALIRAGRAKRPLERLVALRGLRPRDLLPQRPAVAEYSTGLRMGDSAEQMARDWGITREAQDEFALRSHRLASAAWEAGKLDEEVMTARVWPFERALRRDENVRGDTSLERLSKLRPAFDPRWGTITAGNSTPLSDGAAALLMMRESRAKALGYTPLGYLRSYAFTGNAVTEDLLIGPAYAAPRALERAGLRFADLDLIDLHEAFAAQALCVLQAWTSRRFAEEKLGTSAPPAAELDMDKVNVLGGSIAYGHPFAATGARMITQTLRELKRRGGGLALTTACAAGGLAAAMVWEVEP